MNVQKFLRYTPTEELLATQSSDDAQRPSEETTLCYLNSQTPHFPSNTGFSGFYIFTRDLIYAVESPLVSFVFLSYCKDRGLAPLVVGHLEFLIVEYLFKSSAHFPSVRLYLTDVAEPLSCFGYLTLVTNICHL